MKKQIIGMVALGLMMAVPAMAEEAVMSKFKVSLYGFVKLDYVNNSVDLGENGGMLLPTSGKIPAAGTQAFKDTQSIFTARQSRLGLKISGPDLGGAKTGAVIETDFYGDYAASNNQQTESPTMRMRLAYGTVDWTNTQILFGQNWDIFGPMVASTVDFRSGAGWGAPNTPRVPQLRVTQKYNMGENNTLAVVLGLENPTQDYTDVTKAGSMVNGAGQVMFTSKALGTAPGYYGLGMKPLTVGLFGAYGNQTINNPNTNLNSWGYGLYTFIPVVKSADGKGRANSASFEAQIYEAANMSFNGATSEATFGTGNQTNAAKGFGVAAQLIYYPTQELGVTAGYGLKAAINAGNYTAKNYDNSNYQLYLNAAYDFNAAVRVAAEYQYARTNYGNPTLDVATNPGKTDFGFANIMRVSAFYFF